MNQDEINELNTQPSEQEKDNSSIDIEQGEEFVASASDDAEAESVSDSMPETTGISVGHFNDSIRYHLKGMYKDWFLDYASYVILERAVPNIYDGLKPVQRRILHAMKCVDDGRYNKVANIVGQTMQYHPHGDQSIGDALVQLGQKNLLIDCQGNWGNILREMAQRLLVILRHD